MRKFLVAGGVLIVLLVVAVAAAPFLIPASLYEAKIIAAVKQATGRDLTIEGPVSLGLLSGFSLQAEKVSLSNAPGASDAAMMTLAKLEVGLKLMPLLSGDVEVTRLVLTNPVVHLDIDKAGKGNWVFEPAAAPVQVPAADARTGKAAEKLKQLHLGTVKITDGTFTYADARSAKHEALTKVDASLKLESLDKPLDLSGSAIWQGQAVEVSLNVAKPQAAMDGTATGVTLKLSATPLAIDFQGEVATRPVLKLDGDFSFSSPSVRNAAAWAGSPLKPGGTGFGALSVKGKLAMAGKITSVSELAFSLDQVKGSGQISVDLSNKVPSIKGTIALDALDLNPYIAQQTRVAPASAPVAAPVTPGSGWSEAPIDLSALRSANADITLDLASLRFEKIEIGKTALVVSLQNGRLATQFKQVALYGGSGAGSTIVLDGSTPAVGLNADIAMSGIQIQPVLEAVIGIDRLSGTGNMKLALSAHGRSQHDLIATLGGRGSLNVANGAIKGVDFASLAKTIQSIGAKTGNAADQTNFGTLNGSFVITNGVLANNDLTIVSPVFKLTGAGTASLLNRTLDYRVEPNLAGNLQNGKTGILGTTVPILVQGPWTSLTYRPDVQSIISQKLRSKLPSVAQKLLGNQAGGKAGDVLKSFFGK